MGVSPPRPLSQQPLSLHLPLPCSPQRGPMLTVTAAKLIEMPAHVGDNSHSDVVGPAVYRVHEAGNAALVSEEADAIAALQFVFYHVAIIA